MGDTRVAGGSGVAAGDNTRGESMHRRLSKALLAIGAIPLVAAACTSTQSGGGSSGSGGSTPHYPVGTFTQAFSSLGNSTDAATPPPGANVAGCMPSADHPYPVVLVHGTFENQYFNWLELAPTLANAGYCVYTFNYGANSNTDGSFYGLGDIATSAAQLQTEVRTVLQETGASKVDIVGHSQGGMMPRYYINDLGGAQYVHMLVGLAPSNYGTTLDGLATLGNALGLTQPIADTIGASLGEQVQGSSFLTALNKTPTQPGVTYVVIETKDDEVVTPYTNAFLPAGPNVQNITIQNQCPADSTGHVGTAFDGVVNQDVLNALGADSPTFAPTCSASEYGPSI